MQEVSIPVLVLYHYSCEQEISIPVLVLYHYSGVMKMRIALHEYVMMMEVSSPYVQVMAAIVRFTSIHVMVQIYLNRF